MEIINSSLKALVAVLVITSCTTKHAPVTPKKDPLSEHVNRYFPNPASLTFSELKSCKIVNPTTTSSGDSSKKAEISESDIRDYKAELLVKLGKIHGLKSEIYTPLIQNTKFLPSLISLDKKQPEKTVTMEQYASKVNLAGRIGDAKKLMLENEQLLNMIEKEYKVDKEAIVSLWGMETNFGKFTGSTNVLDALFTMALEGRRRSLFEGELITLIKIVHSDPYVLDNLKGSWAGAMGQSQFMPTSFYQFAQDFDGDDKKDIWNNQADVFASIANYLKKTGWNYHANVIIPMKPNFSDEEEGSISLCEIVGLNKIPKKLEEIRGLNITPVNADLSLGGDEDSLWFLVSPDGNVKCSDATALNKPVSSEGVAANSSTDENIDPDEIDTSVEKQDVFEKVDSYKCYNDVGAMPKLIAAGKNYVTLLKWNKSLFFATSNGYIINSLRDTGTKDGK